MCYIILSFSGTMLTAHLRSPSSAHSTSAGAASCSARMPSVALSRGCAGSICVCAVSCSPCVTGLCQSRAASEPAVCAVPAPHWIAWRLGAFRNKERGFEKCGLGILGWNKPHKNTVRGQDSIYIVLDIISNPDPGQCVVWELQCM